MTEFATIVANSVIFKPVVDATGEGQTKKEGRKM